ncbi:MAG: gluconate 2-dehydrogenase subunit 3 family protein [Myxococcota bacterium]
MLWGWLLAGALFVGAGIRLLGGYPRPPTPCQTLWRGEWTTLDAVAEALFPPGGAVEPSGREARVASYVDRLVTASHPRQRTLMRALFFLIEHATLVFPAPGGVGGFRRFSSLDVEQRMAVIEAWQKSGLFLRRLVFTSLRALCTLGYFSNPEVLRRLRLAPYAIDTPVHEADLLYPRIGAGRASITLGPEDRTPPSDGRPLDLDGPLQGGYAEGSS